MPLLLRCPKCQKALKVRDELAGKKVKCPNCAGVVPVPLPVLEPELEPLEAVAEEAPAKQSVKAGVAAKAKPVSEPLEEEDSDETEAPKKSKKNSSKSGQWVPCPKCGAEGAKRVKYTFWGSFYGPRIFSHVRCPECGATYNGKTGGSNLLPAIGCITVPLLGILLILGAVGYFLYHNVYEPTQYNNAIKQKEEGFKSPVATPPKGK